MLGSRGRLYGYSFQRVVHLCTPRGWPRCFAASCTTPVNITSVPYPAEVPLLGLSDYVLRLAGVSSMRFVVGFCWPGVGNV